MISSPSAPGVCSVGAWWVDVADTALASFGDNQLLTVIDDIAEHDVGFAVPHLGSERDAQDTVLTIGTMHLPPSSVATVLGSLMWGEVESDQRIFILVAAQDDAAALASITAIGPPMGDELLAAEAGRPVAAFS